MIEVHPCPEQALSDGPQSMDLPGFTKLMSELGKRGHTQDPELFIGPIPDRALRKRHDGERVV